MNLITLRSVKRSVPCLHLFAETIHFVREGYQKSEMEAQSHSSANLLSVPIKTLPRKWNELYSILAAIQNLEMKILYIASWRNGM